MKSTLRPSPVQIQNPESFQLELQNRFQILADCDTVDKLNNGLVEIVYEVGSKFFKTHRKNRTQKLSEHTLKLMAERGELKLRSPVDMSSYSLLNRQISQSIRHDLRSFNTNCIKNAIEQNKGSKVFARDLSIGRSLLTKLKTDHCRSSATLFLAILFGLLYNLPERMDVVYGTKAFPESSLFGRLKVVEPTSETVCNYSRKQLINVAQQRNHA